MSYDGPSPLARFALAYQRLAPADERRRRELDEQCKRINAALIHERISEAVKAGLKISRERRRALKFRETTAKTPWWPEWALRPHHPEPGRCAFGCGNKVNSYNRTGFCRKCHCRMGRQAPRAALALRLFREGKWTPEESSG